MTLLGELFRRVLRKSAIRGNSGWLFDAGSPPPRAPEATRVAYPDTPDVLEYKPDNGSTTERGVPPWQRALRQMKST